MRLTYDASVNAGYIDLTGAGESKAVARTYSCDPREIGGIVNLDLDQDGRIIGIEILGLSTLVRTSVLDAFRAGEP